MPRRSRNITPATTPIRPGEGNYPDPTLFLDDDDGHIEGDIVDKVNAGARLLYAIYHHPHAKEFFASPYMTRGLLNAYMAAAKAWDI
jgi:hypothetical protein